MRCFGIVDKTEGGLVTICNEYYNELIQCLYLYI